MSTLSLKMATSSLKTDDYREISFIVRFSLSVVLRKIKKKTASAFEKLFLLLR